MKNKKIAGKESIDLGLPSKILWSKDNMFDAVGDIDTAKSLIEKKRWKEPWRLPSKEEFEELLAHCKIYFTHIFNGQETDYWKISSPNLNALVFKVAGTSAEFAVYCHSDICLHIKGNEAAFEPYPQGIPLVVKLVADPVDTNSSGDSKTDAVETDPMTFEVDFYRDGEFFSKKIYTLGIKDAKEAIDLMKDYEADKNTLFEADVNDPEFETELFYRIIEDVEYYQKYKFCEENYDNGYIDKSYFEDYGVEMPADKESVIKFMIDHLRCFDGDDHEYAFRIAF